MADTDEAEAEIERVTEHPVPDPVQAGVQRVVDRQADRTRQLAKLLEVAVHGDPPAVQPGAHPGPGQLAVGLGPRDSAAQLQPAHLDRLGAGEHHPVVERDDVNVVENRHRQGDAAQLDRVGGTHLSTVPIPAPRATHPHG